MARAKVSVSPAEWGGHQVNPGDEHRWLIRWRPGQRDLGKRENI